MEQNSKNFGEVFADAVRIKGYSLEKLASLSGVSERFLRILAEGQYEKLPSAPYMRGYLLKIAEILEVDGNSLWAEYEVAIEPRRSGEKDTLPQNRFRTWQIHRGTIFAIVGGLAVLIILLWRLPWFQSPSLNVLGKDGEVVATSTWTIRGLADREQAVSINGEITSVREDGTFEKELKLQPGFNTFTVLGIYPLGREEKVVRQIFYNASTTENSTSIIEVETNNPTE
jgi:cytoskeletal protein RodZ